VYVNGGRFEMSGGEISGNDSRLDGGGVYVIGSSSIFEMSNGKISGSNSAQYGGGVYVAGGSFGMSGGIISGNSAKLITGYDSSGAGVYVNGGIFEMSNGEISGNSARVNGGGVGVSGSGSNFEMSGGIISDNSAEYGGGVHVRESGAFSKTGTSIIYGDTNTNHAWGSNENTATKSGGNYGHAVYRDNGNYRNSDLPSGVDLSTGSGTNWNQ
jgi:hypothetical protein